MPFPDRRSMRLMRGAGLGPSDGALRARAGFGSSAPPSLSPRLRVKSPRSGGSAGAVGVLRRPRVGEPKHHNLTAIR